MSSGAGGVTRGQGDALDIGNDRAARVSGFSISIRARASFRVMRAFLVQLQLGFNLFPGDSRLSRVTLYGFTQLIEIFKIFNAFPQLGQFLLQALQARLFFAGFLQLLRPGQLSEALSATN